MKCPACGENNDHVIDGRKAKATRTGGRIRADLMRRRRECRSCGRRFNTIETVMIDDEILEFHFEEISGRATE